MKKISVLKLGNGTQSGLKETEMGALVGGNYCEFNTDNQWTNYYSGKCSCMCFGNSSDYSDFLSEDAQYLKYTGIIVP